MEGRLFDKPLNPNKLLKEQFVSNLTGSSLLEIAALSTVVPALVVLRKWSSRDNSRKDSAKKNDDQVHPVHKDWMQYFSTLGVDYLTVVLPIILVFTVLSEWAFTCAISLVVLISIYIMFERSQLHLKDGFSQLPSLRADISSYRVSVVLVTCLCILAVDFKIFPRRYAKAETYGSGIMDLGVGSFVVANALVSRQARNIASMSFKAALSSTSPLVFLGFARIISTWGVDYQVHVGEYGVHWNFFFTLAAVSILTSIVRIHPKHCGLVGLLILAGYQIWLSSGLNEYLISDKRNADIISQNKEGIYSILGYWGMFLFGVSLGFYLFVDTSSKGKNRNTQVMKIWVLAASFWFLAIIFDSYIERVSRRMVLSILTLAGFASYKKNLVLEDALNQNMLGSFLLANILTGLVNLSVNTLSASSLTAFMILSVYTFTLCMVTGLAHFCGVRMKFW
ncbi:uncharacterized protein At4g17910 isoform X2 [Sorghum bicolor]|uniref:Transferase transferring acyl groups n=1 Tax=Sorghum bicolor TaxID=4558 RepID=A0A1B6QMY2_SORBI|nr:uncharacterized protein At4g17910 isoform X2 [Sorghum bicolor]KXG39274.1 hypothetical protein SORBI_3001G356100 [Sorghum bicolor]|eukprot:XP_021309933.1 uncharacterized protein At4g17910 isoform X2 [Sorghum bicolor]